MHPLLIISLLALPIMIIADLGRSIWWFRKVYQGSDTRRSQDISDRNLPVPTSGLGVTGQLMALGFTRLGETEIYLPAAPHVGVSWHFRSADKTVMVDMEAFPQIGILLNFSSAFADQSVVETGYPKGEDINDQLFRSHRITTSVEDSYQHQLDEVAAWSMKHGAPQRIENMADLLHWEGIYRANFIKRKLMSKFARSSLGISVLILILWGVFAVAPFVGVYNNLDVPWPIIVAILMIFGVVALFLLRRLAR